VYDHVTGEADPRVRLRLPQRLPALDGLRGVAILVVLVHVFNELGPNSGAVGHLYERVGEAGWTGVQLFFVLSGFLITGILLDSQRAANFFSSFYVRRTLRIFPLYFGVLAVAFVIMPALGIGPVQFAQDQPNQLWLWTYTSNWATAFGHESRAFPHFWSLAVEEQFYLLWPLLIRRLSLGRCLNLCIAFVVASLAVRVALIASNVPTAVIYQNSLSRMDALAMGGAAAAAFRMPGIGPRLASMHGRVLRWAAPVAAAGAIVTNGFRNDTTIGATIGYTIVALAFVLLLVAIVGAEMASAPVTAAGAPRLTRVLRFGPLRAVGRYSYAMYVFQYPLNHYVGRPAMVGLGVDLNGSLAATVIYSLALILLTFLVAIASWHLFEKRFLNLKGRYAPRSPQPEFALDDSRHATRPMAST
jgi:peptidoglycan/LPS O-acetylase OafA/YrhL